MLEPDFLTSLMAQKGQDASQNQAGSRLARQYSSGVLCGSPSHAEFGPLHERRATRPF